MASFTELVPTWARVVHAHPPSIVLDSMAGIQLRADLRRLDPRAMRMAISGIPVYSSSLTLHTDEQVHAMMAVMGDSDICVLRGHGAVVCGNVSNSDDQAIKLDNLATLNLQAACSGKVPPISRRRPEAFHDPRQHRDGWWWGRTPCGGFIVEWLKNG